MLGTAPTERGQLGGLLGGQIKLTGLFDFDRMAKAVGEGTSLGFDAGFDKWLTPSKPNGGFMSSPLGGALGAAGAGGALGYGSGSPVMGALSGGLAGLMTGNPVMAVAGAAAGLLGGAYGQKPSRKKERDHVRRERLRQFAACRHAHRREPVPA